MGQVSDLPVAACSEGQHSGGTQGRNPGSPEAPGTGRPGGPPYVEKASTLFLQDRSNGGRGCFANAVHGLQQF